MRAVHHHRVGLAVDVQAALVAEIAGVGQLRTGGKEPRAGGVAGVDEVAHGDVQARLGGAAAQAGSETGIE